MFSTEMGCAPERASQPHGEGKWCSYLPFNGATRKLSQEKGPAAVGSSQTVNTKINFLYLG